MLHCLLEEKESAVCKETAVAVGGSRADRRRRAARDSWLYWQVAAAKQNDTALTHGSTDMFTQILHNEGL